MGNNNEEWRVETGNWYRLGTEKGNEEWERGIGNRQRKREFERGLGTKIWSQEWKRGLRTGNWIPEWAQERRILTENGNGK